MRYFIHLGYRGTNYRGWQRQTTTVLSIQQTLESAFGKMTGTKPSITGCGRTDAGVHAMQYFAHFDMEAVFEYDPVERINRILPEDIAVFEMIEMDPTAHSRYDALMRSYEYHIHFEKNPYLSEISLFADIKPNIEKIAQGLQFLKGMEDFRYLCLTPDRIKNTKCQIIDASYEISVDNKKMVIKFSANRFLKAMVRMMIGRLLALSIGKISLNTFENICIGVETLKFPLVAYPNGLHLSKVVYPYLNREVRCGC